MKHWLITTHNIRILIQKHCWWISLVTFNHKFTSWQTHELPTKLYIPSNPYILFYYSWTLTSLNQNDCIVLFSKSLGYFVTCFVSVHLFFSIRVINLTRFILRYWLSYFRCIVHDFRHDLVFIRHKALVNVIKESIPKKDFF